MTRFGTIFEAVHRRSLWQLLTSYAVGSWVVLQLAEVLSSLVGLPLWLGPVLLTLLGIGLVLVLLTALIQGGIRKRPARAASGKWLSRTFTWRNAVIGAGIVIGLLTVGTGGWMGLRAAGIGPAGTLVARGVFEEAERIILAEFENRTQDPTLAETVTTLLRIDLAQSPTITLLEPVQLVPVLTRMQRDPGSPLTFEVARELAQREGLKALVAGEVLPLGNGFVVSARVVSVATGESLAAARASAKDAEQIPDAIDRLSASLRERIGESLRTIQAEPALEQVTTASIDALRDYAQAGVANDAGDYDRAMSLLQQAIDKDSTFAMAHRKLAILLSNQDGNPARVRAEVTRAFETRDRLTERERYLAEAAYHTYVEQDGPAAVVAYEAVLAKYPSDPIALNNLAVAYVQQGRDQDAERLYGRSIAQGGAPAVTYTNAIEARWALGWPDSARATLGDFRSEYPTNLMADLFEAQLASADFDYAKAEAVLLELRQRVTGTPLYEVQATAGLGNVLLAQGRMEAALAEFHRAIELRQQLGPDAGPTTPWELVEPTLRAFARVWYFEDMAGARRLLDIVPESRFAALDPADRDYLFRASVHAAAGLPDQAAELLAEYEAGIPEADRADQDRRAQAALARGAIAEARGRTDDAMRHYRSAATEAAGCRICGLVELATLYDRMGQADSAIALYERYVTTPVLNRAEFDNTNLWRVWLRLGARYEARGDVQQAITYYTHFLDLWADADPDLQIRVREIRDRVVRLTGPRG